MTLWTVIILGFVEGVTEFLPVSSTGHLILVGHALGFTGEQAVTFEIAVQLGAILSVVAYFRRRLWQMAFCLRTDATSRRLVRAITLAFLPAAAMGWAFHGWIEAYLFSPITVAAALVAGGVVILIVEWAISDRPITTLEQIGMREAWWVGIAQCLSLVPGVSRSGATIIGGMLAGMDRTTATEFSFLLALPTMLAATGYKMLKSHALLFDGDLLLFPIGLVVAFVTGLAVVAGFIAFVRSHTFKGFAYYRIVLGLVILAFET
jgi:undecaprenyl-diphosphatase